MITSKKEYKKVAIRFLKEAGLYKAWQDYLKYEENKSNSSFTNKGDWYKTNCVDEIIGRSSFTFYLTKCKQFKLPINCVHIFRSYIRCMYGVDKYRMRFINSDNSSDVQIDKLSGTIKIKPKKI